MREKQQGKQVRVLVVDDSAFNRQTIIGMLQLNPEIAVVGRAANGEEALREAVQLKPDVITLDLEMPRMDGFTFLRILMNRQPTPVIVISSHSNRNNVFKALELGALDFIAKPTDRVSTELSAIQDELVAKVIMVRQLRTGLRRSIEQGPVPVERAGRASGPVSPVSPAELGLVVIGASTGGPPALQTFFQKVAWDLPVAYLVAQHMPANFTKAFADRLDRYVGLGVKEAQGGETIEPGRVYVAPGGSDLVVVSEGDGLATEIRASAKGAKFVPSIDELFRSAAKAAGSRVAAILLTGMGSDGSAGIRAVKQAGGLTIAESEETAVIFGMPREAIASGQVDLVLRQEQLAEQVQRFAESLVGSCWPAGD